MLVFSDPEEFVKDAVEKDKYSHIVVWESVYRKAKQALGQYEVVHRVFVSYFGESPIGDESDIHFLILKRVDR